MIRYFSTVLGLFIVIATLFSSCTKKGKVQYTNTIDDVTVTLSTNKGRINKGSNDLEIKIVEISGKPLINMHVDVKYSIVERRKGMLDTDMSTVATPKGETYYFQANFIDSGEWTMQIILRGPEIRKPMIVIPFKISVDS